MHVVKLGLCSELGVSFVLIQKRMTVTPKTTTYERFIFSAQTFTYKYTCWFWSTKLFKKRGHLFFKSLYLLEIIIDRNSLQWADRIFDALRFIYYLIQKGRSQGSLLCFEWSISFKNLKVKKLNLKMHEIFKKLYSISCISQLTHFYLHQLLNLSNIY